MAVLPKQQRSLKASALQWLAQREYSRFELRRKLMPHALAQLPMHQVHEGDSPPAEADAASDAAASLSPVGLVEGLLDWLEAHRFLSQERFVESRVHARAGRFGNMRIRQELKQHQLQLPADAARHLAHSELERAQAVRERKFAALPASASERARQARFLTGRGFSADVVRRILQGGRHPDESD